MTTEFDVLTTDEVAEILQCEAKTVEDALRAGKLPGVRLGRSWMCPRAALLETINNLARENLALRPQAAPTVVHSTTQRGRRRTAAPSVNQAPNP